MASFSFFVSLFERWVDRIFEPDDVSVSTRVHLPFNWVELEGRRGTASFGTREVDRNRGAQHGVLGSCDVTSADAPDLCDLEKKWRSVEDVGERLECEQES